MSESGDDELKSRLFPDRTVPEAPESQEQPRAEYDKLVKHNGTQWYERAKHVPEDGGYRLRPDDYSGGQNSPLYNYHMVKSVLDNPTGKMPGEVDTNTLLPDNTAEMHKQQPRITRGTLRKANNISEDE